MPIRRLQLFLVYAPAQLSVPAAPRPTTSSPDLHTTPHVDIARFMGKWWVISHVPNFLENGKGRDVGRLYAAVSKTRLKHGIFTFQEGIPGRARASEWPGYRPNHQHDHERGLEGAAGLAVRVPVPGPRPRPELRVGRRLQRESGRLLWVLSQHPEARFLHLRRSSWSTCRQRRIQPGPRSRWCRRHPSTAGRTSPEVLVLAEVLRLLPGRGGLGEGEEDEHAARLGIPVLGVLRSRPSGGRASGPRSRPGTRP
jgi:hypothetical protein